jgi:ribosomal protein S18 acetylase RimI-like enzyme
MADQHRIALESEPSPADMGAIVRGLAEFNRLNTGGQTPDYLLVTVRDGDGKVVGGLVGATYLGWLQVHSVWVPDALRGRGLGRELMAIAEDEARRRGCGHAFLESYSFQAPGFYEKLGYAVHSRLPDFPPGGARYALTKALARS